MSRVSQGTPVAPDQPRPKLRRSHRSVGVKGRLIALVMVPVTVVFVLAGSVVLPRHTTAVRAALIGRKIVQLSAMVSVQAAIEAQRSSAAFEIRFAQLGVTPATASAAMGFDFSAPIAPARAEVRKDVLALGADSPVGIPAFEALWAGIDSGQVQPVDAVERFRQIDLSMEATMRRMVGDLKNQAKRTHAGYLMDALGSLQVVDSFIDSAAPQGVDLSAMWYPTPGDSSQANQAALARFAAETADLKSGGLRLRQLAVPSVVAALDKIEADPRLRAYETAVASVLRADPASPSVVDAAFVADVFHGYLLRATLLNRLVVVATAAVERGARGLANAQRHAFEVWAALAAVLVFLSVGIAVGCARSIAKPLRRLADYAHAINEGDLDADPADGDRRGPQETRLVSAVFSDLVANLRLVDGKANALATCAFDAPVLRQPLPGRLGLSLETSVAVLSGSIVERDRLQTHLAHQATHDALTGLANRPAAIVAIQAAILRSGRSTSPMALLFLDLNEFKWVNDHHGHEVGDDVLRQIGRRITQCVRATDMVARLGGDEFVVCTEQVGGVDEAVALAHRILAAIEDRIEVGRVSVTVGAAIGIALTLGGTDEPLRLLARADAAMYRAKGNPRSSVEIYDAVLQGHLVEREAVELALTEALMEPDGGGLVLHYQPVVEARSGAVVGVEALVRWDRRGVGRLQPDDFIPIAERSNLIIALDRWVLGEVGRRVASWARDPDMANMTVAVNISGRHLLSGQLSGHIADMITSSGIEAARVIIEITETVLIDDLDVAAAELAAVRRLGVRVAIDDFGTGFTSLAHLQHLPVDIIKIDRSFVSQVNVARGMSLVRMVNDLGHAINVVVVAEGVETHEEKAALGRIGVDQLQGYLLSRPVDAAAVKRWVHDRAPRREPAVGSGRR